MWGELTMLKVTHRWCSQFDMQLSHLENRWSSLSAPIHCPHPDLRRIVDRSDVLQMSQCLHSCIPAAHRVVSPDGLLCVMGFIT